MSGDNVELLFDLLNKAPLSLRTGRPTASIASRRLRPSRRYREPPVSTRSTQIRGGDCSPLVFMSAPSSLSSLGDNGGNSSAAGWIFRTSRQDFAARVDDCHSSIA